MQAEIISIQNHQLSTLNLSAESVRNLRNQLSPNTLKNYLSSLRKVRSWLDENEHGHQLPLSASLVADYLSAVSASGASLETVKQRSKAIHWIHNEQGYDSPADSALVRKVMRGMRRTRLQDGLSNHNEQKQPVLVDDLRTLINQCDTDTLTGLRDRALLLVGFAAALRRSELVALDCSDVVISGKGADVTIRKSKTDQSGRGSVVSIMRGHGNLCPVAALVAWKQAAGISAGALFLRIRKGDRLTTDRLSDRSVADLVKKYCSAVGLDEKQFAAHSLRSGMITSAAEKGADLRTLAQHARHTNVNQTMTYVKHANRFKDNPTEGLL